uniref:Peptidase n=1 Tax=viral metagenome TaxID=1070528 RepID=A0A6H1Z7J8_9ZZZZ
MLLKPGIDFSRLSQDCRRSLPTVAAVYAEYGLQFVITSMNDRDHGAGSLHYSNDAYDVGLARRSALLPGFFDDHADNRIEWSLIEFEIYERIKKKIGPGFDVVRESDHIHIEFDPK